MLLTRCRPTDHYLPAVVPPAPRRAAVKRDAYSLYDADEDWSTLPQRKKRTEKMTSNPFQPRLSKPFVIPRLFGPPANGSSGHQAPKKKVTMYLPPPPTTAGKSISAKCQDPGRVGAKSEYRPLSPPTSDPAK